MPMLATTNRRQSLFNRPYGRAVHTRRAPLHSNAYEHTEQPGLARPREYGRELVFRGDTGARCTSLRSGIGHPLVERPKADEYGR